MNYSHKDLLNKILESQEFSGSERYQKLLRYLVQSTLDKNIPKEVTIAYEVFGIDVNSDSLPESNIRVYVHNLRKKLDSYYAHEGVNDPVRLVIPKGRYKVEFIRFLIFAHSSCDETISQLNMISDIHFPEKPLSDLITSYEQLSKQINKFIQYVEGNWK